MPGVPLPPADAGVPALPTLLGDDAIELIGAVASTSDAELRSLKVTQVRYVPGRSVTAQYRADVGTAEGRSRVQTYVAASGIDIPDGTALFEAHGMRIAVWRFPDDPFLPGLRIAVDPNQVQSLLSQVGGRPGTPRIRTRAYRAGRRAVVEVTTGSDRVFLKVLRPHKVAELQDVHTTLSQHVPVPQSHGWSQDQGLVVLQAMPGRTLRKAVESGTRRLPSAEQLVELLDRFPPPPPKASPVRGAAARAASHANTLATLLPEATDQLAAIVDAVNVVPMEGDTAVHGDFHASQLLVKGNDVVGLVDVDTAGVGRRADDLANLLGHLSTLGLVSSARGNVERYGRELIAVFDEMMEPRELRLRVAAVMLGLATGPFRVQLTTWPQQTLRRIELAEEWVAASAS